MQLDKIYAVRAVRDVRSPAVKILLDDSSGTNLFDAIYSPAWQWESFVARVSGENRDIMLSGQTLDYQIVVQRKHPQRHVFSADTKAVAPKSGRSGIGMADLPRPPP